MRHEPVWTDPQLRFKCVLMPGHSSSCLLLAELSGWDKESVIDAFPRVVDCSTELPHAPVMTHDGNPCQRAMIGNEDG